MYGLITDLRLYTPSFRHGAGRFWSRVYQGNDSNIASLPIGKGTTFYSWLDVPSTATTAEIARAYRKKSIQIQCVLVTSLVLTRGPAMEVLKFGSLRFYAMKSR